MEQVFHASERHQGMKTLSIALASLLTTACVADTELETAESEIINGDAVNPNGTGLVRLDTDVSVCSSTLLDNNWLLTAAHCVDSYMDHTYAGDGHALLSTSLRPAGLVIDAQMRAVVAGSLNSKFVVQRLRQDGSPDPTFGVGGRVETDFSNAINDQAYDIALDGYGRIVVVGRGFINNQATIMIARYLANGDLDTSFSGNGLAQTYNSNVDLYAVKVAIDSSNRIYVAASANVGTAMVAQTAVLRYTSTGSLDSTFGTNGMRLDDLAIDRAEWVSALALDASGRPVIAGWVPNAHSFVARYTTTGARDTSFNSSGLRNVKYDGKVTALTALAVDSSGRIVAGGSVHDTWGMAFLRLTAAGANDTSFMGDGWNLHTGDVSPSPFGVSAIAIDAMGRILASTRAVDGDGSESFAVARLTSYGAPDRTFDTDGLATSYVYSSTNAAYAADGVDLAVDAGANVLVLSDVMGPFSMAGVSRIIGAHLDRAASPDLVAIMGSQERAATRVVRHPSLDVALVKLAAPMQMGLSTTGYVSNPLYNQAPSTLLGKTLDCYGYGVSSYDGSGSGVLRTADLKVIETMYNEIRTGVNSRGQALNHGDSGGPCFYNDGKSWWIAGVTSHGTDTTADSIAASAVASWVNTIK